MSDKNVAIAFSEEKLHMKDGIEFGTFIFMMLFL